METILRLIFSKLGIGAAGAIAAFLAFQAGTFHGFQEAAEQCREGTAAAGLKAAKRDLEVAKQAEADAAAKRDQLQQLNDTLEGRVRTYEQAIAKLPADKRCVLSDADVRRLRNIGGR